MNVTHTHKPRRIRVGQAAPWFPPSPVPYVDDLISTHGASHAEEVDGHFWKSLEQELLGAGFPVVSSPHKPPQQQQQLPPPLPQQPSYLPDEDIFTDPELQQLLKEAATQLPLDYLQGPEPWQSPPQPLPPSPLRPTPMMPPPPPETFNTAAAATLPLQQSSPCGRRNTWSETQQQSGLPCSNDTFIIRPDSTLVGESARRGDIKRLIQRRSDPDCVIMSQDYWGVVYRDPGAFRSVEMWYAGQSHRLSRDLQRQIRYEVEDQNMLRDTEFFMAHLDLEGTVEGLSTMGKHKLWVFMPDDRVDRYGPLFSLQGVLRALGIRAGGSSNVCLTNVLSRSYCPTEIRHRTINLTPPGATQSQKSKKECFLDLHALKCFLVAFGHKQLLGSYTSEEAKARSVLSDERIAASLVHCLLHAPLCEAV